MNEPWRDPLLPASARVADLLRRMTLEEKAGQLVGFWALPSDPGAPVAPMEDDSGEPAPGLDDIAAHGLGQLTRVYGTAAVSAEAGMERLASLQRQVVASGRFGIPAVAHEECLTGFMTFGATVFPGPLAWGASFDPGLVRRMAAAIGAGMRRAGVHQGLAPVLDVVRDYRWGRTEECIGEDPYLVGAIGTAYVQGLEGAGVVATLKHFAGYSASRGGRNMAPVAAGPREFADVLVEPFVRALREGGARSVMNSYTDVDGVPSAADERLLTGLLRDELGFGGVVVADYYAVSFLETRHGVAGSRGAAGALALAAGIDVELPTARCYGEPLTALVRSGAVEEALVDRAAERVLLQKAELGLLDPDWEPVEPEPVDLDPPENRALARLLAERSTVLLANDGLLPLRPCRVAVSGPYADDPQSFLGCYSFPNHVALPGDPGLEIPTLGEALEAAGFTVTADDPDVHVLVLGDRAGLFGRGTSGEGCDAETLDLPGDQAALASAVLDSGVPTVLVVVSGRPYALGSLAGRASAVLQAFFPGEEGGTALARIIGGAAEPSGRLPVSLPRRAGGQPGTYLHSRLGGRTDWSSVDPTPLFPFGHGLSWTRFSYEGLSVDPAAPTDGTVAVSATVRNVGEVAGTEVVQLYLSDPEASVVRPRRWLAGFGRVELRPGAAARVTFSVHADRTSFTGLDLRRRVEPGEIGVAVGRSSGDLPLRGSFTLHGPVRHPAADRVLSVPVEIVPVP
ncbi:MULTISPECIES: glycoside hydrolase family 3 N-terminal domain-containing protein [Streptomyces]|uniref:Beta-glucosidase n=1 Tax=Streptomyces fradiae ATCC 10745 = DSM 40063 TaxID=1319510 RepID=A0A1Y2P1N2_STRFR|nr:MULTISPECIES: glycoside hydrolase family 3 N-terminal domain-containing protein [Streptomyces]KAF0651587.1 beta-glucosidase [Streptomyces fradiae ATCC 10745 = DSM 40063]OSY53157.1 Periplasmic beta-glucosidase precursor [Streptomyces fradiae ATCC 10745 = DSM 40063]QEV11033.1 beta-glucosidase [Streptomyces fradiae ATCC 10745 = DSM 40063]